MTPGPRVKELIPLVSGRGFRRRLAGWGPRRTVSGSVPDRLWVRVTRRILGAALAGGLALGLAGCGNNPNSVAAQAQDGSNKGFVAGDGSVEQIAVAQRGAPVDLGGTTVTGGTWSMVKDGRGKVVVVNVWGSWCAPCIQEMPQLQSAWAAYERAGKDVAFVGVDTREPSASSLAFLQRLGVTYPSINDQESGGRPMLTLQGKATATPTTLVLDRQGRIAARVLGATSQSTLTGLVDDVLAEKG